MANNNTFMLYRLQPDGQPATTYRYCSVECRDRDQTHYFEHDELTAGEEPATATDGLCTRCQRPIGGK